MNLNDYYTTAEAAQELKLEKAVIINRIRKGKEGGFPGAVKKGWNWFIPKIEVEAVKAARS